MASGEWFIEWFNSPYYHLLYQKRDAKEARDFLKNLGKNLSFKEGDKILDLACGRGRHSIYLNEKGYRVTGLDLSEANIAEASTHSNENLRFAVHDMREVYPDRFRFILNLFTSFGYFNHQEDNLKVLRSCKKMLQWDGTLVIDFLNTSPVLRKLPMDESLTIEGIHFSIQKRLEDGSIVKDIRFDDMGKSFHFQERVQALERSDFERMLGLTGFELKYVFGDYNLSTFDPSSSPRLILVAKSVLP
ncbi:MAG TPA: class I SAM-dependent methyltransferase [Luteibaculaceae bacterium]|nr:class I SAM-dependent methyltransferase [Luteibaculaceae bacterium]